MDKFQLLNELSDKLSSGEISQSELMHLLHAPSETESSLNEHERKSIAYYVTKMLYVLGAVVVVLGLMTFIAQIWDDLSSSMRIIITLGMGLLATTVGLLLLKSKPDHSIGGVFLFIGGMVIPAGIIVILEETKIGLDTVWPVTISFGVLFIFYVLLNYAYRHVVLTLFSIINGTIFTYLLTGALIDGQIDEYQDIYIYLTMILGVSYIQLSRTFAQNYSRRLTTPLCFFGILGFLGAAFYQVLENEVWHLFYFALIAGCLWTAVRLKSRTILGVSTLFLKIHITYITNEYFADSVGWPITLVVLGFMFIGLGYASISINKKYIAK